MRKRAWVTKIAVAAHAAMGRTLFVAITAPVFTSNVKAKSSTEVLLEA
jgi:hypothetical protein